MRYLGCHVSSAGGFANAIRNARELGVNSIQLHPSAPQRWTVKPYEKGFEDEFNLELANSEVQRIFFHAIYLINLATPDPEKFEKAINSLSYYLDLNSRIKGHGVIVHVGSFKDQKDDDVGYARCIEGVNRVIEESPEESLLLLEVAAGAGKVVGAKMEDLARIYEGVSNQDRIAFALDTQHMWASGYNFQDDLEQIVDDIDRIFSIEKVKIIHFNDSMTDLASRKDRHENIGEGKIGKEALASVLNHPKLTSIPFVLETPALKDLETAKPEVDKLKALAK